MASKPPLIGDGDLSIVWTSGLQVALDAKAASSDVYTTMAADGLHATKHSSIGDSDLTIARSNGLQAALGDKATSSESYSKTAANTRGQAGLDWRWGS